MDANLLLGLTGGMGIAGGLWALVLWNGERRRNGHGSPAPDPAGQAADREIARSLAHLPGQFQESLEPVVDRLTSLIEAQARPPEAPLWAAEMAEGLAESEQHLEQISVQLGEIGEIPVTASVNWPPEMVTLFDRLAERLDNLQQSTSSTVVAELALAELDKLAVPLAQLPGQLEGAFEHLASQIGELLAAERNRVPKSAALPGNAKAAGGGGGGSQEAGGGSHPPPRAAPRALPRVPPGTLPIAPQIPAPYVPGSVFVPAGEVSNLLVLIQHQLSPNCPGTAVEFLIAADPANSGPILLGGASTLGGPLTADNYAYQLAPDSPPRIYRSTYPGSNTPVGEIQVLAPAGGYLHVEVQA